jgi:hypothetical protein
MSVIYRGKGLPKIYESFKNDDIADLIIVSDAAFVNYSSQEFYDLDRAFGGTLVSWSFRPSTIKVVEA